jgi:hypothetical protein
MLPKKVMKHGDPHISPLRFEAGPESNTRLKEAANHPDPYSTGHSVQREKEEQEEKIAPVKFIPRDQLVPSLNSIELKPEDGDGKQKKCPTAKEVFSATPTRNAVGRHPTSIPFFTI